MHTEGILEVIAEIAIASTGFAGIVGALAGDPITASLFFARASQFLNTLGIGLRQSAGGFLIGLYLLLLASGLNFAYLMYVLVSADQGRASD